MFASVVRRGDGGHGAGGEVEVNGADDSAVGRIGTRCDDFDRVVPPGTSR